MTANVKAQLKELDKLADASAKYDKKKVDLEGAPGALGISPAGKWSHTKPADLFGVPGGFDRTANLTIEQNALRQLLGRMSVPFFGKGNGTTMDSADWEMLLKKYPKYFAAITNDLIPQIESKGLLVRTHDKAIRAILTDKYGIVDNTQVLGAVRDILTTTADQLRDLRVVNSVVDRDRLDLRVVFSEPEIQNPNDPTPQGDTRRGDLRNGSKPYGLGVFVTNEETGRGGLAVKSLIWRGTCTNSIIVNTAQSIGLRHIGESAVLIGRLQQAFADALPVAAQTLNRIYEVSNKALPNLTDVITGLAKQYNWGDDTTKQILIGTEGQETVMGLVNGVSFAASKIETSAERVEMETQAGSILVAPDSLFARAAQQSINVKRA
jgi:hypothetical protein